MSVETYLNRKGFKFCRRGEEAVLNCPFCVDTEKKFAVNLITGAFNCKHLNTCGVKGSFWDLQKKLGDEPERLNSNRVFYRTEKKRFTVPSKEIPQMEDKQVPVYQYLKDRGFSDETIKYFHIGAKENAVMFPFYKNGKLTNIKYRDIRNKEMWQEKDAQPLLFNRDNIIENTLIICEGEYDCMALHQYGIEAVSVPNGAGGLTWVEQEWEYLETFKHIKICFDSDDAGKEGAATLAARIGMWKCSLVVLLLKDANECLKKSIPFEEIIKCFDNSIDLTPDTIVEPSYFSPKIQKLFEMGVKLFGLSTPWEELDSILKGWRAGELTIWSGRNGAGKSTILNQVILDIAQKGEKSCIYSGEMSPERYLRWAVIQHKENNNPSPFSIDDSLKWMSGKIYILNISDMIMPDKILEDFEYAARRYDCRHFVIDSLMKVGLNDNDEYNQQKQFVSKLVDFAKNLKVHVHLVAHPRKTGHDDDTPGKVDVKGSSHITDLAFNVIILNRSSEEQKETAKKKNKTVSDCQLYVAKNREFGVEGRIHLWFEPTSKKFDTKEKENG